MASVKLENVSKIFREKNFAVKDVSFAVEEKEFLVLVGPSGCGKTTVLRLIAGLEESTGGNIYINNQRVNNVSPRDRDIAMIFQNYALYPHMNVRENLSFGLTLHKVPKNEIQQRIEQVSALLGIAKLLERKPKELSGGERQRVAMGRAIVRKPKVFLMDEPLSNLDARLRIQMRSELRKLHRQLGITTIYVTHDQTEAMTLGERIIVMKEGEIQQIAAPLSLYHHPVNQFVAGFLGNPPMNFLPARILSQENQLVCQLPGIQIPVPSEKEKILRSSGNREVLVGIRPEDILPPQTSDNSKNIFHGNIELVEPIGSETHLHFTVNGTAWIAKTSSDSLPKPGEKFAFFLDATKFYWFNPSTGQALS